MSTSRQDEIVEHDYKRGGTWVKSVSFDPDLARRFPDSYRVYRDITGEVHYEENVVLIGSPRGKKK